MILKKNKFRKWKLFLKKINIKWKYLFDRNFIFLNPRQNIIVKDYVILISFSKILQNCKRIFNNCFPFKKKKS